MTTMHFRFRARTRLPKQSVNTNLYPFVTETQTQRASRVYRRLIIRVIAVQVGFELPHHHSDLDTSEGQERKESTDD